VIEIGAIQKLRYDFLFVFYSNYMAVYVAICDMFSVKEWCDLENRVRVRSRSLEMASFDRSHTSSYSLFIVTMAISCMIVSSVRYSDLLVENPEIYIPNPYLVPT